MADFADTGDAGFDDHFNPGLFRAGLACGPRARPGAWPRSVSEMRGHVSFAGQGLGPDATDHAFSRYAGARPYERRAQVVPAGRSHFTGPGYVGPPGFGQPDAGSVVPPLFPDEELRARFQGSAEISDFLHARRTRPQPRAPVRFR